MKRGRIQISENKNGVFYAHALQNLSRWRCNDGILATAQKSCDRIMARHNFGGPAANYRWPFLKVPAEILEGDHVKTRQGVCGT